MMPILGDATRPGDYSMFVEGVDLVYQDVAQKRQAEILCDNMDAYSCDRGMLALKARSEDVSARPEDVFKKAEAAIRDRGFDIVDSLSLEQYEKSHMMFVVERVRWPPPTR
jgi:fibrillarin-like pre-rRNA processing protein